MQETSQIRWLMYCRARYVRVDSLNLILQLTGSQSTRLSRGSDGEKRGPTVQKETNPRKFTIRLPVALQQRPSPLPADDIWCTMSGEIHDNNDAETIHEKHNTSPLSTIIRGDLRR